METISRISSMLETARELTLEAAQSAAIGKGPITGAPSSRNTSASHIKKLLDSRHEREVLDGMRRVISLMYGTESALPFFSAVVKNVANTSLEVKKLVYIYLVHYAEAEPDLALLSINTIQKSLTDSNPQVRAMALRTMSGIRVPVISQIVSLAIKRGCADMSPHVRKTAALAIPKCYRLDPSTLPQLVGYLAMLLGDNQYFVAGPAVAAFLEICPDRIDLIHKCYRSLVRKLVDMDEWSQISTLRLLTSYVRQCFPQRTQKVKRTVSKKDFYDDEESPRDGEEEEEGEELEVPALDPDLEFFLRTCKILLQNRNSAVIVSVVRAFLYLAPPEYLDAAAGPLVALLRSPQDIQHVALCNIVVVALRYPNLFTKYVSHFLVHSIDPPHIWRLKLEVLTLLFPHCGMHLKGIILSELRHFAQGTDPELVRESVRAIGRCAQTDPDTADYCLDLLLGQIASLDDNLVSETLTVIRHLIQQDPASHEQTVIELVKHLGTTNNPDARATIVWLVGEFAGVDPERNIAPDVLRILVKGFADESEAAKQQIVLLGAKVYLHHLLRNPPPEPKEEPVPSQRIEPGPTNEWADDQDENKSPENQENQVEEQPAEPEPDRITLLWQYLLLLTRYDTSYDLRDRARLYKALLSNPSSTDLANLLLLAPKPVPHTPSPSETRKNLLIGSATLIIGSDAGTHGLRGYEDLPSWVESGQEPDPNLREQEAKPELTEKLPSTAAEKLDRALREHQTNVAALDQQRRLGHGHGQAMASASKGKKTLDEWLEAESETEEETDSEEEVTDSEEETDDEEEETDSEEEESEEETDSEGNEEGAQLLQRGSGYAQSSKDVP
ncbi:putative AP-3 adaptor complex subunit beta [Aspergillus campestris IBT 28561]|uniref:AP-3 adaptor complex subunit beta n=1 Tax=Aspergillus campestris (strain IBT 28561) TaxID=1392248 RepID=A0A2I1D1C7_ASPC2|nr:putative AP-3 adaptor complex subunit beta [Aspergillus campestris IBT 28561]PKY03667.1 putative AP-3 adaptor complex subunit beta [Aspergillus campestris IBT 28561]